MDKANFEIINEQIKSFISSYQENPFMIPLKRITSLHRRLLQSLEGVEEPTAVDILKRMDAAITKILDGDDKALYSAEAESYHTLLWKLHQHLLKVVFK